jgi:hypothetical protein
LAGFNLAGLGPLVFTLLLLFNDSISIADYEPEEHVVSETLIIFETARKSRFHYVTDFELYFKDGFLSEYPYARRIDAHNVESSTLQGALALFTIKRGIIGFRYIADREIRPGNQEQNQY